MSSEKLFRRVIVRLVSSRNVGNTWNVSAIALLLAAVVLNVVSALVIRLRSAAGSLLRANPPNHVVLIVVSALR